MNKGHFTSLNKAQLAWKLTATHAPQNPETYTEATYFIVNRALDQHSLSYQLAHNLHDTHPCITLDAGVSLQENIHHNTFDDASTVTCIQEFAAEKINEVLGHLSSSKTAPRLCFVGLFETCPLALLVADALSQKSQVFAIDWVSSPEFFTEETLHLERAKLEAQKRFLDRSDFVQDKHLQFCKALEQAYVQSGVPVAPKIIDRNACNIQALYLPDSSYRLEKLVSWAQSHKIELFAPDTCDSMQAYLSDISNAIKQTTTH